MTTKFFKRNLLVSVMLLVCMLPLQLQAGKLDLETRALLKLYQTSKATEVKKQFSKNYLMGEHNGVDYVKVYVQTNGELSDADLQLLDAKKGLQTKTITLVTLPVVNIEKLVDMKNVEKVQVVSKIKPYLDKAIPSVNADKVHNGTDLKRSHFGEGVIVGVVDVGLDFTHPMFRDENGNLRIKRAWLPTYSTGMPPAGFDYGTLFTDSSLLADGVDFSSPSENHGTHVTGIAAGSAVHGNLATYVGVAPKSDIAIVTFDGDDDDVFKTAVSAFAEACSYLFSYADSVGKPIAINFSAGDYHTSNAGDGMSLGDKMVNELVEANPQGKILIAAAGNDGTSNIHCEANMQGMDSSIVLSMFDLQSIQSFWGEQGKSFEIKISALDIATQVVTDLVTFNPSNIGAEMVDTTVSYAAGKNMQIIAMSASNEARPNLSLIFFNQNYVDIISQSKMYVVTIRNKSQGGIIVHGWNRGAFASAAFQSASANTIVNSSYTVASPAAADSVIAVGSYNTRAMGNNAYGKVNDISAFSSLGPLTNGVIKPDITAPGSVLYSASHNFYEPGFMGQQPATIDVVENGYKITDMSGTSMACPMVTGIVALLLEMNPKLSTGEIKDILRVTAINDTWTGDVRNNKSPTWGWGKINAWAAVKDLEESSIAEVNDFEFATYPNPSNGVVNVKAPSDELFVVNVYNESGELVYIASLRSETTLDLAKQTAGTYFVKVSNAKKQAFQKIVLQK